MHLNCCFAPTDDNKFSEATAVLFTWIERGEVSRRTSNHFYSMIQSANSHVRRLMSEKALHEEEMERAKEAFKNALLAILTQCKNLFLTPLCQWERTFQQPETPSVLPIAVCGQVSVGQGSVHTLLAHSLLASSHTNSRKMLNKDYRWHYLMWQEKKVFQIQKRYVCSDTFFSHHKSNRLFP